MIIINILILSDLQGVSNDKIKAITSIPKDRIDLIVSLGDIDIKYLNALTNEFRDKPFFGVLGNHDLIGQLKGSKILDLGNKKADYRGLTYVGVEGCVRYKNTKFNPMYSQEQMLDMTEHLPKAEIVLSHNSPYKIHDKNYDSHAGYKGLIRYIDEYNPLYCIHGHQHVNKVTKHNDTYVIGVYGASILNTDTNNIEHVISG